MSTTKPSSPVDKSVLPDSTKEAVTESTKVQADAPKADEPLTGHTFEASAQERVSQGHESFDLNLDHASPDQTAYMPQER